MIDFARFRLRFQVHFARNLRAVVTNGVRVQVQRAFVGVTGNWTPGRCRKRMCEPTVAVICLLCLMCSLFELPTENCAAQGAGKPHQTVALNARLSEVDEAFRA